VTDAGPPGPNPITLFYRHVVQARAQVLFAGRRRLADLGATPVQMLKGHREMEGAYALPGDLDPQQDLAALGRALAAALQPGAPVLLAFARYAPGSAGRLAGVRAALGPAFDWHGTFALGVIAPAESRQDWARRHPQSFGVLAVVERLVRGWPLLREAGEYAVIEGSRRATPADTL